MYGENFPQYFCTVSVIYISDSDICRSIDQTIVNYSSSFSIVFFVLKVFFICFHATSGNFNPNKLLSRDDLIPMPLHLPLTINEFNLQYI